MDKKILLVEDDEFLRQIYVDLLAEEGLKADSAVDGEEGYTKITTGTWDLVLLDVVLPKMSGFDIMEKLIAEKKLPDCPIVFMTNLDGSENDRDKLSMATTYWIKSSMAPPDFVTKVKKQLGI